jgi:hypothetical protein
MVNSTPYLVNFGVGTVRRAKNAALTPIAIEPLPPEV